MGEGSGNSGIAEAVALHREGRLKEAEAIYRRVLASDPDNLGALHNYGALLAESGRPEDAMELFDRVLTADPGHVRAHANRGGALETLGRDDEAAAAYGEALSLHPDMYPIHLRRALILLAQGDRAGSLAHLGRTRALRRDPSFMGADHAAFARTSKLKLAHDAAQFRDLAAKDIQDKDFDALASLYEDAVASMSWPADPAAAIDLPGEWRERLSESYNAPLHHAGAPEVAGSALRATLAVAETARAYTDSAPGIAVIDGLLSPAALRSLQCFLLESTIWHDFSHIGGFLAAYLEDGMACPLLLQIADELRTALPGILGPHPLRQAWAFKSLTGDRGIDIHADSGAVSLNFWITPTPTGESSDSGGLVVHLAEPPPDWAVRDYDQDKESIRAFLAESDEGTITVPYAENRAVLFRSGLFHRSGKVRFPPGYGNHRINITLLFGDPTTH